MNRITLMTGLAAVLAFASSANAGEEGKSVQVEEAEVAAPTGAAPVRLVSWDGDFELLKTSRRLRIWRSHVAYRMSVDAQGNVTDCELTETFRRAYISQRLCAVLSEHHTFAPAQDDDGTPVAGSYSAQLSYQEMRERM